MSQPFAVWLMPSHPCHLILKERISALSSEYRGPIFNPHCTLCSGQSDDLEAIIEKTKEASAKTAPLKVPTQGIGYRSEYFQTLFVALGFVKTLRDTHSLFIEALSLPANRAYMPHISLLYARMTLTQKSALAGCVGLPLDCVSLTSAAIVIPDNPEHDWQDVGSWQAVANFKFRKEDVEEK